MSPRHLALLLTLSLAALLASATSAQAAGCDYWYGAGGNSSEARSGSWGTPGNWSTGLVPESTSPACITVPGTYTVELTPYGGTHYGETAGDSVETLTLGAASGTQTLAIVGQSSSVQGVWQNQTTLGVIDQMTIEPHGRLVLDATEGNATGQTGEPHGGSAVLLQGENEAHSGTLVNNGTILTESSSSRWVDGIGSRGLANAGSLAVNSGSLGINNEAAMSNSGSISTASGAALKLYGLTTFSNTGSYANAGSTNFYGNGSHPKWIQGGGAVTGNPVDITDGAGLEASASGGPAAFAYGPSGGGYLLGTVPADETIDVGSTGEGAVQLSLAEATLTNYGTINLDVPAGANGNTNVEVGSIVNHGRIQGTVEDGAFKNVIDVPLSNESGGLLDAVTGVLFDNRPITNDSRVEVSPGSVIELVATNLANGGAGVLAPQIAGPFTYGHFVLNSGAVVEAAGTLAPTLVGGFTPTAGEDFKLFEGTVKGSFGAVSGGFSADYTQQAGSPASVGAVYGAGPKPTPTTSPTAKAKILKVKVSSGRLTVTLTCPRGTLSCGATTVRVLVTEHVKVHARKTTRVVVVASGTVSLAAGATATLKLRINSTGRPLLRKNQRLKASITVTQGSSKVVAAAQVTLKR